VDYNKSEHIPFPVLTDELLNALDSHYPQRHPDLSLSDREVWFRAGQRSVVDYLIEQQQRQRDNMLTNVLEHQI
tara:strand:- start:1503 stop:1724 length:222 start_codon:yes stop_codon:yes gene_type:complete